MKSLDAILNSPVFTSATQLSRFLRFVVEQELAGNGAGLKEFTLGVEVFRKGENFDPRTDTVVRTEARRLREKLTKYYRSEGEKAAIEIVLSKGSYRPEFRYRTEAASSSSPPRNSSLALPFKWSASAAALAVVSAVLVFQFLPSRSPAIAILPFENLSADSEQEYLSAGVTEALITDLAKIRALRVISRPSVQRFERSKIPVPEIARQLRVEYVVEGSVTRSGGRVRITAQLINASDERHIWAESFERSTGDLLALQGEIAREIATQIDVNVTPKERVRLTSRQVSPDAHELYLKGMFNWHTRVPQRLRQSVEYFSTAIAKEPTYAPAYVGLANTYGVLAGQVDNDAVASELLVRGQDAARKAIELDNSLGEARISLVANEKSWDWVKMEQEFRRALESSPNDAMGHTWFGWVLCRIGRSKEGLAEIRRGLELDPLAPSPNFHLGAALLVARQYDEALRQFRQTLEVFPNYSDVYQLLGMTYLFKGMPKEAVEALQQAERLSPAAPRVVTLLAYIRAVGGDPSDCRRLLAEYSGRPGILPVSYALLYLGLGDRDHAFEQLQKAVSEYSAFIDTLKVQPIFDGLHRDPRYHSLLRQMNLE